MESADKDSLKSMKLIDELGCEGYGIYLILSETLREQKDGRYQFSHINNLSRKYNTTQAKMEAVVTKYDLFVVKKGYFSLVH